MEKINSLSGKTHGIWKFCQNTGNLEILPKHREFGNFAKTQGIWFCQVVNSLILKVKDISVFAPNISKFVLKLDKSAKSVSCI